MQLTRQDKIIAAILIAHGLLGSIWAYWAASQLGFPALFLATNFALAAMGVAAGIGSLRQRRWAVILGLWFFVVQLLQIVTPSFQFSFTLGFSLNVGLGWAGSAQLSLNLFSLAMLLWSSHRASARFGEARATGASA